MVKAISVWQPWASLVAIGAKPFETRSWKPPEKLIGERVAIHAGKKKPWLALQSSTIAECNAIGDVLWPSVERVDEYGDSYNHDPRWSFEDLPLGAILCTAVLLSAFQVEPDGRFWFKSDDSFWGPSMGHMPHAPDLFGDYSPGRWVWRLADVRKLTQPAPWKGRQGWFEVGEIE